MKEKRLRPAISSSVTKLVICSLNKHFQGVEYACHPPRLEENTRAPDRHLGKSISKEGDSELRQFPVVFSGLLLDHDGSQGFDDEFLLGSQSLGEVGRRMNCRTIDELPALLESRKEVDLRARGGSQARGKSFFNYKFVHVMTTGERE